MTENQMTADYEGAPTLKDRKERRRYLEADIVVATGPNDSWGVVSLSGGTLPEENAPMIIHLNLESREAAEAAREEVIDSMMKFGDVHHRIHYSPLDFDAKGRVLFEMGADLSALARRIAEIASGRSPKPSSFEDDLPF